MTMTYSTRPTPDELRELSTAELALILLGGLGSDCNINSTLRGHEQAHAKNNEPDRQHLLERVSDAWAWLVAYGLVGPHPVNNPADGWMRLTQRGHQVRTENSVTGLLAEQRLPDDLHPSLAEARRQFRGGNAELAVFEAMKQVEVHLRDRAGLGTSIIGVPLARKALHPDTGPLTNSELDGGERQAIADLFAGALGAFKNPTSHRIVDFDDPALAADAILLADLLLRLADQLGSTTE
jgi:uncharacterized protein (TIGR02391 family)